jgi:hypothetical protein
MKSLAIPVLTVLAMMSHTPQAEPGVIPLGLNFKKNIFLQEVWKEKVPYYVIANLGNTDVTVSVFDRSNNKLLAGPWKIAGKSVATQDVSKLIDKDLIDLRLADGSALGILFGPRLPKVAAKGIASFDGLNGSGGRSETTWIEQSNDTVKAGEVFEVKLKVVANSGQISFPPQPAKLEAITVLTPFEVVSDTLPVAKDKNNEVDSNKPIKAEALHTVTLRFHAPAVEAPTMVMIQGLRQYTNGSAGLVRGVVVVPAKAK